LHAVPVSRRSSTGRVVYASLAALLLAAIAFEVAKHGSGYWQLAAFGVGPDLALLVGVGTGLRKGQLHPRAVPLYNLVHRYWGPIALGAAASFGLLPVGFVVGALAWALHVSLDRAVGYGLRTRDGFQRA
jgi:hypothetical protein